MKIETIRERARQWAAEHPDVKVLLDEDEMDMPDAVQISVNDPDNEYGWTGFMFSTTGQVFMTETSDDIEEDERESLEASADNLLAYLSEGL